MIIKNCPFCGSKARTKRAKYNEFGNAGGEEKQWYGIYCPSCHIGQPTRTYFSKQESIDAWNKRCLDGK